MPKVGEILTVALGDCVCFCATDDELTLRVCKGPPRDWNITHIILLYKLTVIMALISNVMTVK